MSILSEEIMTVPKIYLQKKTRICKDCGAEFLSTQLGPQVRCRKCRLANRKRLCLWCKKELHNHHGNSRFDSFECRLKWRNLHHAILTNMNLSPEMKSELCKELYEKGIEVLPKAQSLMVNFKLD